MNRKRFLAVFLSLTMVLSMMPGLAFAETEGEISAVWTTEHFNYDGTTVTGFSDAGKELLATTTDVVIPDKTADGQNVTAIGASAFAGAYNAKNTYTSFKLPATVESIGASAFAWGVLSSVNLPDGLASIGTSAFMNNALESVSIPDSVTTMGDGVYSNNIRLKSVTLSNNLTSISKGCFTSCPIDSIVVPEGVTTVAANAFKGNGATSISLPSTLVTIGDNAFEEAKISELEIPASVKSIGKYAFRIAQSPVKLEKLVLHEGLESIAKQAFKMNAITEVYLPTTVKTLAADTFYGNTSIVKVYYKDAAQAAFGTQTGVKGMELIYTPVQIGEQLYGSLEEAVAAVKEGETISVLDDCSGNGIVVPSGSSFTIDFGGHTYTIDGDTVGSTGTETNGFQLLKDSTITFKNGTITSDKAKILIQNYSNLTLDNMILDGSNNASMGYVLSNNNGDILIKDTTINAASGNVAFDVCRYASYPSVKVTVDGSSVIDGVIELYASNNDAKDGFELVLNSGDFSKSSIRVESGGNLASVSKGEEVEIPAPSGQAWGNNGQLVTVEEALNQEKDKNNQLESDNKNLADKNAQLEKDNAALADKNTQLENEKSELQKQLEIAAAKVEMLLKSVNVSASSVNYNTIKLSFSAEDVEGFVVDGEDVGNVSSRTFTGLVTGRASSHTVKAYITVNEERVFTREFKVSAAPKLNTPAVRVYGAKKRVTSSWGKISGASRYQVSVSTSRAKTSIKYTGTALKYTKKSLKSKKTYYVKVRAYRTVAGKKVYGSWSAVKAVKTK